MLLPDTPYLNNKFLFHLTASGCYTALCLASLSLGTDIIVLKSKPNWLYFFFLFFSSLLYYNFHKISWYGHSRMLNAQNLKYQWPSQYPGLLLLALMVGFAGTTALFSYSITNLAKMLAGLIACFLALFYNQKIWGIQLRSLKGFKAFTIAAVAVITAIVIPIADQQIWKSISFLGLILFIVAQFFFITALCIAADIRDVDEDKEDKIKTFPVASGMHLSKKLILLVLFFQIVLLIIQYQISFISIQQLEGMLLVSMLSMLVSYHITSKNTYYYFILTIDGLIVMQTLSIYIIG